MFGEFLLVVEAVQHRVQHPVFAPARPSFVRHDEVDVLELGPAVLGDAQLVRDAEVVEDRAEEDAVAVTVHARGAIGPASRWPAQLFGALPVPLVADVPVDEVPEVGERGFQRLCPKQWGQACRVALVLRHDLRDQPQRVFEPAAGFQQRMPPISLGEQVVVLRAWQHLARRFRRGRPA